MRLSFVVPAHNESRLIGATLRSIHETGRAVVGDGEYEIIVADDSSQDATGVIAATLGAHVVRVERRQISAARNAGARAATGEVLVFVDADTLVNADVVRNAIAAIEAGALGGGAGVAFDGQIPAAAGVLLKSLLMLFRILQLTGGCFLFCRRDALEEAGGWDETVFASEEVELANALKQVGKKRGIGWRGRFVIVEGTVLTSGRKLRAYSLGELLWASIRIILQGRKGVQKREGLEIWYERREDVNP